MLSVKFQDTLSLGLRRFSRKWQAARSAALVRPVLVLWDVSANKAPTPALDTGYLRGSGAAFVENKKIKADAQGAQSFSAGNGVAAFGYNAEHAVFQHEMEPPVNYSSADPKIGPKFIEEKLARYGPAMARLFAEDFEKELAKL